MSRESFEFKKPGLKFEVNSDESVQRILELIQKNFFSGEKSVAFGSTHYKNSQEKSIVLACDFFNKKYPTLKILVVSFDLLGGVFAPFIDLCVKKKNLFQFQPNIFFMDWEELLQEDASPQQLVDEFDMVFWDLPSLETIGRRQLELRASFSSMDSLYLVSLKDNKFDNRSFMLSIMHYYQDHGLDIRTILPWQIGERKRKPKSKISRLLDGFFSK